jgi:hypothetical protein
MLDESQLTEKLCTKCGDVKPIKKFRRKYDAYGITNYYESHCTDCRNAYVRGRYDYDKERDKQLRQNYGISLDEYNELFKAQNGVCAVCGCPETRRPGRRKRTEDYIPMLHVDHDHKTGKIRGLLCSECNTALGSLHDDPNRIKALLKYIEH